MQIKQFNHFYQLLPSPRFFPVNSYLVQEDDGLTLIDTGMAAGAQKLIQAIQGLEQPLRRILVTHFHYDHTGGLDTLCEQWPDISFCFSARDTRILDGDLSLDPSEPKTEIKVKPPQVKARPDRYIKDGDKIGSLEVIATPGHTPGSLSYYDPRSKTVFVGDALQVAGGVAVAGDTRLLFPFPALATWDKPTAVQSAKRLLDFEIEILASGHGLLASGSQQMLSRAVGRAERKQ